MIRIAVTILLIFSFFTPFAQTDSVSSKSMAPAQDSVSSKKQKTEIQPPVIGEVFKPKISLGTGMMSFYGDLYNKHYQAPWTGRYAFDLNVSQSLSRSFQLNFNVLFGKLGANEWLDNRQQNFQSEIRSGGISLTYDFGNLIPDRYKIRPWISAGVSSFEFLSKTDMYDNKGNKYYYWSDGSIKNMPEGSPGSQNAVNLVRDYRYETDIRELNADGFGKYPERAWAFPIGFGAIMKVTDRVDFKMGVQYYFTTTDYIDGITSKSVGNRAGNRQNDRFVYTSFALQYDLVIKRKGLDTLPDNYYDDIDWLAIDNGDYDQDGVNDFRDKCHGTPKGVPVDSSGCPYDDDLDHVPNYADKELQTPAGSEVNMDGVALTDEYWQDWFNHYMDSTGEFSKKEVVENFYAQAEKQKQDSIRKATSNETVYTVELARYQGAVPTDEMTKLLSIGDVKSAILSDNTTVVYTSGSYNEIGTALKKREEYRTDGYKNAQVGYFKNDDMVTLSDDEINKLIGNAANTGTTAAGTGTESAVTNTTSTSAGTSNDDIFEKGTIVYRVQLGAYKHRISKEVFRNAGNIIELQTEEGIYRYVTKGFKTINGAAALKADLVVDGYTDAFITAYQDGKRIPMNKTAATMETTEKENLDEKVVFSSVNKELISFKVQLGALRKAGDNDFEEKTKEIQGVEKQATANGMLRYTTGEFKDYSQADKLREELNNKGYSEAFVIAIFKGEVISIQEALDLLK
ncbi:MAG: hypothetical protein JST26_09115 [Bacteroidetes bacterium]|nr:hypothetical protein [Bacteroidota bacterium]